MKRLISYSEIFEESCNGTNSFQALISRLLMAK
jgi:hypothetical protein